MVEQILMGASAVITLSTAYVAWHYANKAQYLRELLAKARDQRDAVAEDLEKEVKDNITKMYEIDRMAEVIGSHQAKAHKCDKCNQFASKRAAKTAELREYVASKAAL